jgi:hypothetical protein
MDIAIERIWEGVGPRYHQEEVKAEELAGADLHAEEVAGAGPTAKEFALVLYWPASTEYLTIEAKCGGAAFSNQPAAAVELLESCGVPRDNIPAQLLREGRSRVLSARVARGARVTLEIGVDTDHQTLLEDSKEAAGTLVKKVEALAVAGGDPGAGGPASDSDTLYLHLRPATRKAKYDGFVALDLGNTNSTLVCLPAHSSRGSRGVDVVRLEHGGEGRPIPTAVRIRSFQAAAPDAMPEADCRIGAAAAEPPGELILGPKRLLADTDSESKHVLRLGGQSCPIDKAAAAELFIAGMFRAFHRNLLSVPRQIAITCPSTFSDWEIRRLREAFIQGWRRSVGAKSRKYDPKQIRDPDLPDMIIDEASAAAFYFLYRDFLDSGDEAAVGVNVLHYLHPQGLNLLVYDCGGGTTDIALVHARAEYDDAAKQRSSRLLIEVLGRTGHREFGGDNITIAAFKILKAKLAARLAAGSRRLPEFPQPGSGRLATYLEENRQLIDQIVPTFFVRDQQGLEDQRRRMETTDHLWQWAEQFKIELGKASPTRAGAAAVRAQTAVVRNLEAQHTGDSFDKERATKVVQNIELDRAEVDELIRADIEKSIEYANRMIKAKLPDSEVHCVYVVGNASRYPLVGELIRAQLDVPFIEQRLKPVPLEDLKNSVAKGAVLALRVSIRAEALGVDFDRRLCEKLPFDVTFADLTLGRDRTVFREHEEYQDLKDKPIPVPNARRGGDERRFKEVFLRRLWPGDDAASEFLRFQFPDVIRGPLKVWYDNDRHKFVMSDDGGSKDEVVGVELQKALYVAPVQKGDL